MNPEEIMIVAHNELILQIELEDEILKKQYTSSLETSVIYGLLILISLNLR